MTWYSTWLPGLPSFNFAIPTSIQGRFLSFILKKSLGHLLKPGQLDHHQIDSQIGSGYVQVNDLQLDPQAIDTYLEGLPLALQSGTISSIKARIPWPNPLASSLGFSLKSLHLIFHVVPLIRRTNYTDVDLAESVASVAETFIDQELSPGEEATLLQSFHQEAALYSSYDHGQNLPGGLGTSITPDESPRMFDTDPAGVSVFASLIERLLARFEFDAQDIKITLIHPGNIRLILSLEEIQYRTDRQTEMAVPSGLTPGENRTLSINGLIVSSHNLAPPSKVPFFHNATESPLIHTPVAISRPLSRTSSESSMDDDAQFAMSQSLAALPPRPPSSVGSVSSSMYESAISTVSMHSGTEKNVDDIPSQVSRPDTPQENDSSPSEIPVQADETLLSFGTQPISVHLSTPSPVATTSEDDNPFLPGIDPVARTEDDLRISVSIGVIACAIRPWQIQSLLRLSQAAVLPEGGSQENSRLKGIPPPKLPPLSVNAQVRGIVALLHSPPVNESNSLVANPVSGFFEKPLVPPPLEYGYTRIYFDAISGSLGISNAEVLPKHDMTPAPAGSILQSFDFSVADLSVFIFKKTLEYRDSDRTSRLLALPLLMTDPHLPSQYIYAQATQPYSFLPMFDVIDWTDEKCQSFGTKLSQWRCHSKPSSRSKYNPDLVAPATETSFVGHPAIRVIGQRSTNFFKDRESEVTETLETQIAPLNVRIDLELLQAGGFLSFFEDLIPVDAPDCDRNSISSQETVDMYSSIRNISGKTRVSDCLNFDGPIHKSEIPASKREPRNSEGNLHRSRLSVDFSFIRLAIRCPPPPQLNDRSGTLIIDLHDISIVKGPAPAKARARFSAQSDPSTSNSVLTEESILIRAEFGKAFIACSMVSTTTATTILSISSLTDDDDMSRNATQEFPTVTSLSSSPLKPSIHVIKPSYRTSIKVPVFVLSVDVPSVCVHLSKPILDALQYWADDITQLLERLSAPADNETEGIGDSRDTSLIGSRFFAKSRSGSSGHAISNRPSESAESVVKVAITEALVRVIVPRTDTEGSESRPFDLKGSDLDILVELNPDSKQQTILTVGLLDLVIENTDSQGRSQRFLSLTSPHSLSAAPKSIVKLRFSTLTNPIINTKETQIKLTLCGFTYTFFPDVSWISDLASFAKNPPGTFESVIPSDRTRIFIKIQEGSIRLLSPKNPGAIVSHIQQLDFSTDVVGDSRDSSFHILATALAILALDDTHDQVDPPSAARGISIWTAAGYALLAEISELDTNVINQLNASPLWKVLIPHIVLRLHLCADTLTAVTAFIQDFGGLFKAVDEIPKTSRGPTLVTQKLHQEGRTLMSSVEDLAFKGMPAVGSAPDMIYDDLPTNLDYLDESFGAAAGLRELRDDDVDEFDEGLDTQSSDDPNVISKVGGETIKISEPRGLEVVEDYFLTTPPDKSHGTSYSGHPKVSVNVTDGNFALFLYDGYDWTKTRKTIEEEVKEMRKRLTKIKQLVANGQMQDPTVEDTSAFLFNSVHIGLEADDDLLAEPSALIAAIDEELGDDLETASQSSWQSLRPSNAARPRVRSTRVHGKRLTRSKAPSIEFCLAGLQAEFDQYQEDDPLVSRTFVTVRDLEILDHIKTSTWRKFLTQLRSDSRGNVRETDSNMVRIELRGVRPVPGNSSEEARLRAKILPLRLYVDQDAVDFLKKFFSFKDADAPNPAPSSNEGEAYIQLAEIFPIDLKLDYKPRRVDYRALKEGRTIELMNFFHFDGAEMTLRHITLAGVTGWPKLFEMLNDLWTPDVKATQLVEVISGVAPIRSVVNVGSGVADLILLPLAQYKKDGRIVRGVQKGATAFVKSTAIEAIKMGAKLATGTQVILEQAEGVLGGRFETTITAEPVQMPFGDDYTLENEEDESADLISKYAQQPADLKEGVQTAYKSLQRNFSSAAQTILAVPMEVYERSGNEGPVRSVIRAVPIAVLKPMIGASEAVSKTLLGLHNTLDPNVRHENEAKYKLR